MLVLLATALAALGLYFAIDTVGSHSTALFLGVLIATAAGFWLDRKSREWFRMTGEDAQLRLRSATIELARTEPNPGHLVREFEERLRRESQASFVVLGFDEAVGHDFDRFDLAKDSPAHSLLCQLGWATPEGLQRRRSTEASRALQAILARHSLGLIIPVPRGSPHPSLLVVFGVRENAWPFTYPEVQKFQNVAELMDNILTRSRLTAQAALEAKTEHLAMLSRGLAHDLKNLLTPVSSFLVYSEGRFPADSVEAEVHGAAQRSIRIMSEYVREARFFADQLTPRFERVALRTLFDGVREVVQARAAARNISLAFLPADDASAVVDRVLIQRLLANLVANAIDASAHGQTVTLSGEAADGHLRFQVKDQGCGIAPEHLGRIFEAYYTTKEFGDTVRGFGLGLTICQKIAALHDGEISVQSEPGKGSTFTVSLPARPAFAAVASDAAVAGGAGI